jgi:Ice-binding-like
MESASRGFVMANKGKQILTCQLAICVILATGKHCTALPVDLGAAGPDYWTVLETGTGVITQSTAVPASGRGKKHGANRATAVSGSSRTVIGNVGVGEDGRLSSSGAQFQGDLYLGNNSSAQFSGSYAGNTPIVGTAHLGSGASVTANYSIPTISDSPDRMLDQARIDAATASMGASALAATSTLSLINLNRHSLTLGAGVYNLSSLRLTRSTLTLSGSGSFVFNISSAFALKSAKILLAGGATEANVLFNYTGTRDVTLSKFSRRGGSSVLHGIVLALNARVNLAPGLVVGEIISGKDIAIGSGSVIATTVANSIATSGPKRVNVPDGASTFVLTLIALGALFVYRSSSIRPRSKCARAGR